MKNKDKELILIALEEYLQQHQMSAAQFAKKSGVNASIISSLRSGKTTINAGEGKEVEISDKYYKQIAHTISYKTEPEYWKIVETRQLMLALSTLQDAREYGYTNVIIGDTGSGKTFAAELFAQQHPHDVFMIKIGQTDTIGDMIDKIMDAARINSEAKGKSRKLQEITNYMNKLRLDGFKPMIILDEAEFMKQPAMCAIKLLYDELTSVCGIVMIGTPQLLRNLEKLRRKDRDGIPQFYRRIKFGIRRLDSIDRSFKQFFNALAITDREVIRFVREVCDNYGEVHDVIVPTMREIERTGAPFTVETIKQTLNYRG